MSIMTFAAVFGLAVLAAGCVQTVSGTRTAGLPFGNDKIESRYQRPADEVYQAAKQVIQYAGALVNEKTLFGQTNTVNNVARTIEGKVNQNTVWVRVEQIDPKITDVTTQARTQGGSSNLRLAAEIDKRIALKLAQ